jgi:FtsP/CotA-like multicopper oxidase with cupredoxin domain
MYTMHGALIVLPPNEEMLDDFFRKIDFKVAILQHMYADESFLGAESIYDMESLGSSEVEYDLVDNSDLYDDIDDSKYNLFINGLYQPMLDVEQNEWFGLRFIHVGAQYSFALSIEGCQAILVSRDGVYLNEPLVEDVVILFPGNRADIAFRCEDEGVFELKNVNSDSFDWMCDPEDWVHCFEDEHTWMLFNVSASDLPSIDWPLDWLPPPKPFYLQDLSLLPFSQINGTFELIGGFDGSSPAFNNHSYTGETDYLYGFAMHPHGVYQINLTMDSDYDASHPIHVHVNHFQIVDELVRNDDATFTSAGSGNISSLYRIGEHRDTVILFPNRVLVVRYSTFGFTGSVVVHCHYLTHNDLGMITAIAVSDGVDDDDYSSSKREDSDEVGSEPDPIEDE